MRLHTQQHVSQVLLGIDAIGLTGGHQRVEVGEVLPRGLVADEEKILPAQGCLPQRGLGAVVVQGQARVGDEARQGRRPAPRPDS